MQVKHMLGLLLILIYIPFEYLVKFLTKNYYLRKNL